MLVAISGSQGSGKSTILTELKEQGYNVIERKTSRSILQDWDVTLDQVNTNPELTIEFQEEIIQRKWDDELPAYNDKKLWFTERTYIDLLTYTLISIGKENQFNTWLNEYYDKCVKYCAAYDKIFYVNQGCFAVESDGVRGENKHYSYMVDLIMSDITQKELNHKVLTISQCSLKNRINTIIKSTIQERREEYESRTSITFR